MSCIFCKIINKEESADIVYEDHKFIVIKNIQPKAPVHLLIIPKEHIPSVNHFNNQHKELIGELFLIAKSIAKKQGIAEKGYKLVFNVGKGGGQVIFHLHLHLLGGWKTKNSRYVQKMP